MVRGGKGRRELRWKRRKENEKEGLRRMRRRDKRERRTGKRNGGCRRREGERGLNNIAIACENHARN